MPNSRDRTDRPHGASELLTGERPDIDARLVGDIMQSPPPNGRDTDPDATATPVVPVVGVRPAAASSGVSRDT